MPGFSVIFTSMKKTDVILSPQGGKNAAKLLKYMNGGRDLYTRFTINLSSGRLILNSSPDGLLH